MRLLIATHPIDEFVADNMDAILTQLMRGKMTIQISYWERKRAQEFADYFRSCNFTVQVEGRNNATYLHIS